MRVGVGAARRSKACKGEVFWRTSCEVPFCTFISFANFKQAESEFKKKKNYHSFAAYFKGPFFFINKGSTKKKCRVLNEFMQVTVF